MYISIGRPVDHGEEREFTVRIDPFDTWSASTNLARIIVPMLKQLKETKQGIPADMPYLEQSSNSAQASFDFYADNDNDAFVAAAEVWSSMLDKMIFAFEHILDEDWEKGFEKGRISYIDEPEYDSAGNVKWYCMKEGLDHTYVCDYEGIKKIRLQIEEGLHLFAAHFQSLWD